MTTPAIVECDNCRETSPIDRVRTNGDRCPHCGVEITDDATVTIPTDLIGENWGKIHGDDYEPVGGVDFKRDEVTEPDRDVDAITETLKVAKNGDVLALTIGSAEANAETPLYLLSHERDTADFDHRLSFVEKPTDDNWTRMYITAIGGDENDPWEVVSAPYNLDTKTADMRDLASNGWLIAARDTDKEVERTPRNPDRDGGDRRGIQ